MKTQRLVAAIIGLLLATQTQAAEIKVLASTALKTVLEELGPNSIRQPATTSFLPSLLRQF